MTPAAPLTRDLVLVGGGHSHALVLRMWGMNPLPGARLTVINPGPTAPYSGMLPGHIAGHYSQSDLEIDLVRLCRFAGARLVLGQATWIDPVARELSVPGRPPIGYDVASLDIGITAELPAIPGFAEHGIAAKPLDSYAARWRDFLDAARPGTEAPVAVIGGGVAGVELALAMAHALRARRAVPQVTVLERASALTGTGTAARARLMAEMAAAGIAFVPGVTVARIEAGQVVLEGGRRIASAFTVGAAGAVPHPWLAASGLPCTDGFVRVGADLAVEGHPGLFAAGDCAHLTADPRPKAGVFAVRAAPVLLDNLRAALTGGRTHPFRPQRQYLKLVSLGDRRAMAEKFGLALSGRLLWRWKDRIDRRFMERFATLPAMPRAAAPAVAAEGVAEMMSGLPLCGGCGAKVGSDVLRSALGGLPDPGGDVLSGPGDDAAVLKVGEGFQILTTDHLRAFTEDPWLLTRIAAVHALGDVWAMGAAPQAALASVILPRMSARLQARTMAEVTAAAVSVLGDAGAALVGGHSTMGAEMTVGFTLTGLRGTAPVTIAGARPGDALVLTRPLGSGVLLAAEMAGRARGRDIAALWDAIATPQARQAALLAGAHAMTDVTGFGLAGHLSAICKASGVGATLDASALPLYPGAAEALADGTRSVLHEVNATAAPVAGGDNYPVLWDPQTGGGLLAAIPPDRIDAVARDFAAENLPLARIGTVTTEPGISIG